MSACATALLLEVSRWERKAQPHQRLKGWHITGVIPYTLTWKVLKNL